MKNVLAELKQIFKQHKISFEDVICADIERGSDYYKVILKQHYTKEDLTHFLNEVDFEYDDSFDGLYGIVWLTHDRWLDSDFQPWIFNLNNSPKIPGHVANPKLWKTEWKEYWDQKRKETPPSANWF